MLGAIYFNNQLCRSTVKVHNEFADNSLFVNFYRIFAEKKIPELALMGSHFSAKPPGVFQLAVIFWYGHIFTLSVGFAASSPKGRAKLRSKRTTPKGVWKCALYQFYKLEFVK